MGQEKALASAGHVSSRTPQNPGCNKLALCEKLKLCVTFYKISFLSQILAMVLFCFPPISMKGTASNNYDNVYRAI